MATEDQCGACGERNPDGSAFCLFCGSYLGWDEAGRGPTTSPGGPAPGVGSQATASRVAPAPGPSYDEPRTASSPGRVPTQRSPSSPSAPAGAPCPHCRQPNSPTRRFCSRCGYQITNPSAAAPARVRPAARRRWWNRWGDPEERRARREYRRSLPPLYRWRRVIVIVATLVGLSLLLTVMSKDPVGWLRDRWYDLRDTTTPLAEVTALEVTTSPPTRVPKRNVTDRDPSTVWGVTWHARPQTPSCGGGEADGYVELRWNQPIRVRKLEVEAGLAEGENDRDLEFRPEKIDVTYRAAPQPGPRVCRRLPLDDIADPQAVDLDTRQPVTALRISIASVFDAKNPKEEGPVSIRRLIVRSRPQ